MLIKNTACICLTLLVSQLVSAFLFFDNIVFHHRSSSIEFQFSSNVMSPSFEGSVPSKHVFHQRVSSNECFVSLNAIFDKGCFSLTAVFHGRLSSNLPRMLKSTYIIQCLPKRSLQIGTFLQGEGRSNQSTEFKSD